MLHATGCVNITPFDKEESEVGLYFLIRSIIIGLLDGDGVMVMA